MLMDEKRRYAYMRPIVAVELWKLFGDKEIGQGWEMPEDRSCHAED